MTSTSTEARTDQLTGTWDVDPTHSSLEFAARHAMVTTVRGRFADFDGVLRLDAADPARSSAEVTVRMDSLDTRSDQRDEHLRSPDFFDVATFPTMTFTSTRAEAGKGEDEYRLWGELTIRDVTREVAFDLTFNGVSQDPWGKTRAGFEGRTTVNRKDWGLTWNVALEAGGLLVSDKVKLTFDIAAVKRDA